MKLTLTIRTPQDNELTINLLQDIDDIGRDIAEFLTHYNETSYKVIDCNGFLTYNPSNEELENIELINKIAWIIEDYDDVACILLNNNYSIERAKELCEDAYYGFYASNDQYAKDYIDNILELDVSPEILNKFIDLDFLGKHLLEYDNCIVIPAYNGDGFYVFLDK